MSLKVSTSTNFRSVFRVISKDSLQWFPGHMNKGIKQMQQKLRSVDCIIEVHDARVPFSGRNADFKYKISGIKPHILVLNKVDTIETKYIPKIKDKIKSEFPDVIFTNCKNHQDKGIRAVFPLAQKLINASDRYNRADEEDYCIMIIGIPNVGKSSLTNALRNRHLHKSGATQVGANPGITRSVLNRIKMCEKPLFYMLDTPGILSPNVDNTESGLRLALCNTIQDHLVGPEIMADYLLYWMNKNEKFEYVKALQLSDACDNILEVLAHVCKQEKKFLKFRSSGGYVLKPDLNTAAQSMIKRFRNLEFGKIMLDEDLL